MLCSGGIGRRLKLRLLGSDMKLCRVQILICKTTFKKEGDDLTIGEIIQKQQPDVYKQLIKLTKFSKEKKVYEEKVDFKRLMEDAPTYKRHHGSWRQVRHE
jgi:hypothetical protein